MHSLFIRVSTLFLMAGLLLIPAADAASKTEIDARVKATMTTFYSQVKAGKELANKSVGMLVFPEVFKAGLGIGGEFGEGALLEGGKTTGYYNTASASIGLQFGAQVKSEIIMFMTRDALKSFQASDGWKAGVDGSVALITVGAGQSFDTNNVQNPIIGFIFSNKGLMYNLSFEGSKITRITN
ncbi:MAG: YSC84-related protein [Mariprofundus sp.]